MAYPLISEYIKSIKMAEETFATLTNLRPMLDDKGEPVMSSGNFAVVFKMQDTTTNELFAVKCFIKDQEGRDEAYHAIAKELSKVDSPYFVKMQYLENELFVDSSVSTEEEFSIVVMEWVEGVTLDKYIKENIDNRYALELLSYCFCQLAYWLVQQPFAHGDLKPDNIIVRKNGMLTLVDYDGMYVPEMFDQKARELGSPNFRHPQRTTSDFDEHIDDLPLVSISLALRMAFLDKKWFTKYSDSEHFIFQASDFANIVRSEVFHELYDSISDRITLGLIHLLLLVCKDNAIIEPDYKHFVFDAPCFQDEAFEDLYVSMAQNGNMEMQAIYGGELYFGEKLSQHTTNGLALISDSIYKGCTRAEYILGACYGYYDSLSLDPIKVTEWNRQAAEKGNTIAQNNLGDCYYYGEGVERDYDKAVEWYIKAAKQGNSEGQYNLGGCYYYGDGVEKDHVKAARWMKKAAEQGCADAQYDLGLCYENGKGVAKNATEAKKWYTKAADQGNGDAIRKLKKLQ